MDTIVALYRDYPVFLITVASIFGLLIGSFLNVVAIRVPLGQSVVHPPSHCGHCQRQLGPLELIPVISYFILGGKCRHCGTAFSIKYAIVEAITGLAFGFLAWQLGFTPELAVAMLFAAILIVITLTDISHMMIPNKVVFCGMAATFVLRLFVHPLPLWNYVTAFFVGGGILYALAVLSLILLKKEGMGGGDIKLLALIGLVVGIKLTLLTIFAASLLGTLFGVFQMIRGTFDRDRHIPFGPFIAMGAMLSYLWGNTLLASYIALLF